MKAGEGQIYEVIRPVGEVTVKPQRPAERINTLEGKTICEAYNGVFRGDRTFPKIREILKERYPSLKFVPYSELPTLDIVRIEDELKKLPDILRQKKCDALITGNGG